MNRPTLEVVGTPDLPRLVSNIFGDKLLPAHEKLTIDGALIGYRVSFMDEGKPMLSNVLVGDDGITFYEDDVQEMAGEPDTFVPCRTDYHVCPDCLREIRAHAYNIEGESDEDRPHPAIDDAWDQVEGCAGFCGGDHCANPPQRVYWTKPDGSVQAQDFPSTAQASLVIAGIVQWHPALVEEVYLHDDHASLIEAYEALSSHQMGHFLRLDRDPDTGEPKMPDMLDFGTYGELLLATNYPDRYHHEYRYHGVVFVAETENTAQAGGPWAIAPKTPLPEPLPRWG